MTSATGGAHFVDRQIDRLGEIPLLIERALLEEVANVLRAGQEVLVRALLFGGEDRKLLLLIFSISQQLKPTIHANKEGRD